MHLLPSVVFSKGYARSVAINVQKRKLVFIENGTDFHSSLLKRLEDIPSMQGFFYAKSFSLNKLVIPFKKNLEYTNNLKYAVIIGSLNVEVMETLVRLRIKYIVFDKDISPSEEQLIRAYFNRFYSIIVYGKIGDVSNYKNIIVQRKLEYRSTESFILRMEFYIESLNVNSFYFQKIYLLSNQKWSFNGVKEFAINNGYLDILNLYQEKANVPHWYITKSKTEICMHCEFQNICQDNRLPTQRQSDGQWYHTTECNYNPYIAKWKGEEGYCTLAECGVKSDETGFSINHGRIAKINEELWGED